MPVMRVKSQIGLSWRGCFMVCTTLHIVPLLKYLQEHVLHVKVKWNGSASIYLAVLVPAAWSCLCAWQWQK